MVSKSSWFVFAVFMIFALSVQWVYLWLTPKPFDYKFWGFILSFPFAFIATIINCFGEIVFCYFLGKRTELKEKG